MNIYKTAAVCLTAFTVFTITGLSANGAAPARYYKPPPESYLRYSVYSVSQLIQELQNVPSVRARYARHFQIPEDQVVQYMKDNLVESWVPQTRTYTVYCVNRKGQFFPIHQRFVKGTKVFALRNGQPVLKWICGNPLSRFLPTVMTKTVVTPVTKVSPYLQELTPSENERVLVPNEAIAPSFQPLIPLSAGSSSLPFISQVGSHGIPALFLLPAAFLFGHGGGSSSPTPLAPVVPVAPSVPEPASAALLVVSLPALLLLSARRRKVSLSQGKK